MKTSIVYTMAALSVISAACSNDDNGSMVSTTPAGSESERLVRTTPIVSDEAGAMTTDKTLINAWGLAFNPAGIAWISSTEAGVSKVYSAAGEAMLPGITIPNISKAAEPSAPTGQVFNSDQNAFDGDVFVFVTEHGVISGWQQVMGGEALVRVDNSATESIYKGVTIARDASAQARLYATDFHNGKVDVFDATYAALTVSGGFRDPQLPDGFAPFNVEELNGSVLVTYAKQDDDKEDDVKGSGNGFVDQFDLDGTMMTRLISGGELSSPWGITMSPSTFAAAPGRLLVGNFGDGLIHVYGLDDSSGTLSATLEGPLLDGSSGKQLMIDGLWALKFGPDAGGFSSRSLYYTAGPADEKHGVFGRIDTLTDM